MTCSSASRAEHPFELVERDIESDERLLRAYLERIPVVALDGRSSSTARSTRRLLRGQARSESRPCHAGSRRRRRRSRSERLSLGVAARLSRYLQVLTQARKMGRETISSHELADYTHVNSTQIRRDLSGFGKFGKRGVGYNVESLRHADPQDPAHRRPAQHRAVRRRGTSAARSPPRTSSPTTASASSRSSTTIRAKVGERVGQHLVRHNEELRAVVEEQDIVVGVLAVPTAAAQGLADDLVAAGVKIIFNYSDALLDVPPETTVHTSSPAVDLLYALYFYLA